ncbi:diguanylate cyclase (GGDEF)-like protein [Paraburkholderia sp. BL6669N2]|nr:diguanylate cyclase (GGDEF)-like protein [Paraburkholderia sp. BL6669N2]
MKRARDAAQAEARSDALTRLANRRYALALFDAAIPASIRTATPLSIALLDLDRYKHINDHHGHLVGDDILQTLRRPSLVLCAGRILLAALAATSFSWFFQVHRWTKRRPPSSECDVRCLDVQSGQARDGEFATRFLPGCARSCLLTMRAAHCRERTAHDTQRNGRAETRCSGDNHRNGTGTCHSVTAGGISCKCPYPDTKARPLENRTLLRSANAAMATHIRARREWSAH